MEELFFLVSKKSTDSPIEVCGCITRTAAHLFGFPHTTVLLVPTTWDEQRNEPIIFVHKRSPYKRTCPNTWDFCGGHLTFKDWHCHYLQNSLNTLHLIERISEDTAVREANEELKCNPSFEFLPKHIHLFKSIGYFECQTKTDKSHNIEFSTAYVVVIPNNIDVSVWDTDKEGERKLEVKRFTLKELLSDFENNPHSFADGAGRILKTIKENPSIKDEFSDLLLKIIDDFKS